MTNRDKPGEDRFIGRVKVNGQNRKSPPFETRAEAYRWAQKEMEDARAEGFTVNGNISITAGIVKAKAHVSHPTVPTAPGDRSLRSTADLMRVHGENPIPGPVPHEPAE